ncbi:MAG: thioredoxin domain-containing protein [Proteobacteria bacterium]|nr:thioredoxin domain-containing protein [Pseudomonadota bacterium]
MRRNYSGMVAVTWMLLLLDLGCATVKHSVDLRHAARLGGEDAPIEVVVFSDFQCIFCKRSAIELKEIFKARPDRVKIYFKHFPLSYHPQAVNAARAAEAARLQDKFWEMHDLLFARSADLTDEIYEEFASEIGLDVEQFKADMDSPETANRILADRAEGEVVGVNATPYILINGAKFHGSYSYLPDRIERLDKRK